MAILQNDIYIGSVSQPLYHFTQADMKDDDPQGTFAQDLIGKNLSIDTFSIPIHYKPKTLVYRLANGKVYKLVGNQVYALSRTKPKDYLKELPFGTPVWWFIDGVFHAKGYLKSVDRVSSHGFKLTCVSGVGLLDSVMHVGGLYQNTPISTVLASIIGSAFTYSVSAAVQAANVGGHLKYKSARDNLHELLFSLGASLTKGDSETDYIVDYLGDTVTEVPASRVALQGSVNYQLPSNRVEVTEHAFFYLSSAPTETLFDNTGEAAADNLTVIFDNPVYVVSLATTGSLTVSESGVNYAVVSGVGALTGQKYIHTTQIDVLENNPNNEPVRVNRVETNELITALNARNVARRVLSYYQSAKTVKAKIMLNGERCGNLLRLTDAFGDVTQAYLARMDTLVSSVIGAQCQLVEGYRPGNNGNNYLHRQMIDAAYIAANGNTWTVPMDIPVDEHGKGTIRLVLIGGADGGSGGYDGEEGAYKYTTAGGELTQQFDIITSSYGILSVFFANAQQRKPAGGAAGTAGSAGKVYIIEKQVSPGEDLTWSLGVGGVGGSRNGGAGAAGTPTSVSSTSIGTVSSASGLVSQGYFDPFTGDSFATPGQTGYDGGDGGQVDTVDLHGCFGGNGLSAGNVGSFAGGKPGVGVSHMLGTGTDPAPDISHASGGAPGGAAYGANGGDGGNAVYEEGYWYEWDGQWYYEGARLRSGAGGNGANASPFQKPAYGVGGGAGNGGGGGGNCGGVNGYNGRLYSSQDQVVYKHQGGAAGKGSAGGPGGDGAGVVYW